MNPSELKKNIHENPKKALKQLFDMANGRAAWQHLASRLLMLQLDFDEIDAEDLKKELEEIWDEMQQEPASETPSPIVARKNSGTTVLTCKNVSKKIGNFVLQDIDLELKTGEITALVGKNAGGKTTLLRLLAGQSKPSSGEISYSINKKNELVYLPQELPGLDFSIKTHLHFHAAQRGLYGVDNEREVAFMIERLGLSEYALADWNTLSGGYRLRFSLAKCFLAQPKLLLLDEPFANLDMATVRLVLDDLRRFTDSVRYPMSLVISSHHLDEIEAIADNLLFLEKGTPIFNGKLSNFGKDRTQNVFEFSCNTPKDMLLDKLQTADFEYDALAPNILGYIIYLPPTITPEKFMKFAIEQQVNIKYFKDISTSSQKELLKTPAK